ncbi:MULTISPECIES: entericidin A/B family lipoprotein [Citrifermentans]|uniref:Entericidin superfamily protein n=1 Tax=Citrifermentans bemidjiense (strain ATCC BAA-1014 / DSM 16622 / JCM 12645 / Bem) TaxID=404380 RepID=B5EIP8_CITBB|nr:MULTISPECIES: entericidin A/B family lipoprotein [Citrifermentans]ACH38413.1 entericidin superfamily protein [Citrifermentans bemidjiense Bem]
MKRKIAGAIVVLAYMVTMSACHTVKGVGQDMQSGGRSIENSSGK